MNKSISHAFVDRETPEVKCAEVSFAMHIEAVCGCTLEKLSTLDSVDWKIIKDGKHIGYAEAKCRNIAFGDYPTAPLAITKFKAARKLIGNKPLRFLLFVRYTDGDFVCEPKSADEYVQQIMWARNHPGEPPEPSECCFIPISEFKRL